MSLLMTLEQMLVDILKSIIGMELSLLLTLVDHYNQSSLDTENNETNFKHVQMNKNSLLQLYGCLKVIQEKIDCEGLPHVFKEVNPKAFVDPKWIVTSK